MPSNHTSPKNTIFILVVTFKIFWMCLASHSPVSASICRQFGSLASCGTVSLWTAMLHLIVKFRC